MIEISYILIAVLAITGYIELKTAQTPIFRTEVSEFVNEAGKKMIRRTLVPITTT